MVFFFGGHLALNLVRGNKARGDIRYKMTRNKQEVLGVLANMTLFKIHPKNVSAFLKLILNLNLLKEF